MNHSVVDIIPVLSLSVERAGDVTKIIFACDNGCNEIANDAFAIFGSRRFSISLEIIIDEILMFIHLDSQLRVILRLTHW